MSSLMPAPWAGRLMGTLLVTDDTTLFKPFMDNPEFKRWLSDTIFQLTYDGDAAWVLASANDSPAAQ